MYEPVIYLYGKKPTTADPVVFIQEALVSHLCDKWNAQDAVMIFYTEKSEMLNWDPEKWNIKRRGLKQCLNNHISKKKLQVKLNPNDDSGRDYIIPVGFTNDEIWEIFNKVYEKLQNGDEIYFDVTHAFRTIPMFTSVLFNYCRFMKNTTVKGVYYGAFESLGSIDQVRKITPEKREVPIVDMTSLVSLQSVNVAASNFSSYGGLGAEGLNIASTGNKDVDEAVVAINNALYDFEFYLQVCRLDDIKKGSYIKEIEDNIAAIKASSISEPHKKLLESISNELTQKGFKSIITYENVEAAVLWAIDHCMIQQALTLAREYFPYRICESVSYSNEFGFLDKKERKDVVDVALTYSNESDIKKKFSKTDKHTTKTDKTISAKKNLAIALQGVYGWSYLMEEYSEICRMRNKINHASSEDKVNLDYVAFQENIKSAWRNTKAAFDSLDEIVL